MQYKAHEFQEYATNFIIDHPTCGLLLDLSLGKSVIALTALRELILDRFEVGRVLIIAPKRVAKTTWPGEIEKWDHLSELTYSVVIGTEQQRREALMTPAFIYIINRENVVWLIENGYFHFDMIIIDELSSFKSYQSKRFKALRKVRSQVKRVVGLTGTPGNLMDLWAEIGLLDMGERLGRFITRYREEFFVPDKRNQMVVFSYKPKARAEEAIYDWISDICVSMKAADYIKMPELLVSNVEVFMDEKEQKQYDQLKADLVLPMEGGGHRKVEPWRDISGHHPSCLCRPWIKLAVWWPTPDLVWPWSLELYQQCCGHLYRQGQEHTVTIQHITTKGTMDEKILAALEKRVYPGCNYDGSEGRNWRENE